jgi:hypothetical protein
MKKKPGGGSELRKAETKIWKQAKSEFRKETLISRSRNTNLHLTALGTFLLRKSSYHLNI